MTGVWCLMSAVVVLLVAGWWLSWVATRLDRAHARAERSWAVLDTHLVRRAQRAVQQAQAPGVDPASALLVCDAAGAALERDLTPGAREQAESTLTHVLQLVALTGLEVEQDRATLARRLHNDAVSTARAIRRRRVVRVFRLAGRAAVPRPFEMADDRR